MKTLPTSLAVLCLAAAIPAQLRAWEHPDNTTHWYQVVSVPAGITWAQANRAASLGEGYLVTITSKEENAFVFSLIDDAKYWMRDTQSGAEHGPWTGAVQLRTDNGPGSGWGWAEIEAFGYTNWTTDQPDDTGSSSRGYFGGARGQRAATWADAPSTDKRIAYVVEYSGRYVPRTVGLIRDDARSYDGYTMFNSLFSTFTHMIDPRGRVVNAWRSDYLPGAAAYFTPRGTLLRCGRVDNQVFAGIGGRGGIVEEFDWDGKLTWSFTHSSATYLLHHDIKEMPNGNLLMIAWEVKTKAEAIAAGRNPALMTDTQLWPEKIIEVERTPTGGRIVWEWHAWDHLIQDFDRSKANHGDPGKHPELIDLNYLSDNDDGIADWLHANTLDYNPQLDQILFSPRSFDEIWIIDHSTTTAEAASHRGGRSGKGGDLLYRWGNPQAYRAGTAADRQLFLQHDCQWIPPGHPGAGNILVFSNGDARQRPYSSVEEIVPPTPNAKGNYPKMGKAWGPARPAWTYTANDPTTFFSRVVSGAQRLPNGNTLICSGWPGDIFEVTPAGAEVWHYRNPIQINGIFTQGHGDVVANGMFRAPRYGPDFPGLRGKDLTPGEPIEPHETVLLVDGSTLRREVERNDRVEFSLRANGLDGRVYVLATSLTRGSQGVDHRFFNLGVDTVLLSSITSGLGLFQNYVGLLDGNGRAKASMTVPNIARLVGARFETAFIVVDPSARSSVPLMSNRVVVQVVK